MIFGDKNLKVLTKNEIQDLGLVNGVHFNKIEIDSIPVKHRRQYLLKLLKTFDIYIIFSWKGKYGRSTRWCKVINYRGFDKALMYRTGIIIKTNSP